MREIKRRARCAIASIVIVTAHLAAGGAAAQSMALAPGDAVPELVGWDLEGQLVRIDWSDHVTLVNFWATWCEPCRREMPALQGLQDRLGDRGFRVIGMVSDVEVAIEDVQSFLEDVTVEYPIYRQDRKNHWERVVVVPTSYLVDAKGKLLRKYVGATPEQIEGLVNDVEAVLDGREMGPLVIPPPPTDED